MKKRIDVIAAGHICLDIIPEFISGEKRTTKELFVPGKLINIDRASLSTGGSVPNTGIALARLGIGTALMGKVGTDPFGKMIGDIVAAEGVDSSILISDADSTSYSIIFPIPGHDRIIFHNTGANDTFNAGDPDYSAIRDVKLFHFGYPPLMKRMYEKEGDELESLLKKVKETGATTSLDMSLPDPKSPAGMVDWQVILSKVLKYVDIFVPSIEEIMYMVAPEAYQELHNDDVDTDPLDNLSIDKLPALGEWLIGMGVGIVVLKCGSKGFYIKTANKERLTEMGRAKPGDISEWANREVHCECYSVEPVRSAAGSGDNSIAGFLAAFLHGSTVEDSIKIACVVGAQNVLVYDTISGVKDWEEVAKLMDFDTSTTAQKLGMTSLQEKSLKKKKYNQKEIDRIAVLIINSKMTYEDIVKKLDKGTSLEKLEKSIRDKGGASK